MSGKHATTELYPQPLKLIFKCYFQDFHSISRSFCNKFVTYFAISSVCYLFKNSFRKRNHREKELNQFLGGRAVPAFPRGHLGRRQIKTWKFKVNQFLLMGLRWGKLQSFPLPGTLVVRGWNPIMGSVGFIHSMANQFGHCSAFPKSSLTS